MKYDDLVDAIGHTPVVRLRTGPATAAVYAKLEMHNVFAMKDRVAKRVILEARANGLLQPGAPIFESSSGTMALGLALVGTLLGHPVHIVTDPRIDEVTLAKLRSLGCSVHVVDAMTSHGWQSARLTRLAELMAERDDAFCPRQYYNPQNPLAYGALADELVADLGRVDVLVGAVGSGGSLCGTARALRRAQRAAGITDPVRVIGVDAVGSVLFEQPDRPGRRQSGLGNSLLPGNLSHAEIDEVHWLNDHEAFAVTRELARDECIFAGNSSGSVYQVLRHLAWTLPEGATAVGIFPDRGDRYVDTIYSDDYWDRADLRSLPIRPEPEQVAYGTEVAQWSWASVPSTPRRRLLFVESNTTGTGMLAMTRARELGLTPVLLTSSAARYRGVAETDCEIMRCDTNDQAALTAALREAFDAREVAGVTTSSEFYLGATAVLAAELGLPGNPPEAVRRCRDKSETRKVLTDAGLPQPVSVPVCTAADVAAAVARTGLPCVVKPVADSASTGVLRCETLEKAVEQVTLLLRRTHNVRMQRQPAAVLVEQLVSGAEVSVETIFVDGRCHVVGITRKDLSHGPAFVELRHAFPAVLEETTAGEIERVVIEALEAVGVRHGVCHTEVRLADAGPTVIEINARPAGGMIPELIRLAGGPDLLDQQLRAAIDLPMTVGDLRTRTAGIAFITSTTDGEVSTVDGLEEARTRDGVAAVHTSCRPGDRVRAAADAYDRLGHVIATGGSIEQVDRTLDLAMAGITVRLTDD
ncbi:pyridoxal-phosphate dependent enzyme [Nocardioides sp. InS609-2]|uniref:pyridoxal-phosphate dependent enzyme n=1 Tax=Nocardioides sp. InS609-2 TaxID=2760705 RepID=UPI0020BEA4A1|nr:pyridoxal-phosphate dependent enzyme [Nocardioides sp. InS609-2]